MPPCPECHPATLFETFKATTPFILAVLTFLWYRRGRLWKFFYTFQDEAIKQSKEMSLDRIGWNEIAKRNTNTLATDYFGVLCQFELDFLRYWVNETKLRLWRSDKSSSAYPEPDKDEILVQTITTEETTDKVAVAKYIVGELYYWKFAFFGTWLFIRSLWWVLFQKDRDPGFKVTKTKKPIRGLTELLKPDTGASSEEAV